jgi:chaperonin GroEL (HSP60 family)
MSEKKNRLYPTALRERGEEMLRQGIKPVVISKELKVKVGAVRHWKKTLEKKVTKEVGKSLKPDTRISDAIVFLRCARKHLTTENKDLAKLPRSGLYTLLALDSLEGK